MVVIGDVLAVIGLLVGTGITAWALIMGFSLLFAQGAAAARDRVQASGWKSFLIGLGIAASLGTVAFVLAAIPNPLTKLVGTTMLMVLLAISIVGAAGLSLVLSQRMRMLDPNLSAYGALGRSAAILVVSMFFPFLGWFFIAPLVLVLSMGAGFQALTSRVLGLGTAPQAGGM